MVENLLVDNPKPLGVIMEKNGYGSAAIHTPSVVTESAGFKQALAELGLTQELITTALVEDIREKPKNRLGELRLGAEILGMSKTEAEPPQKTNQTTYNFIFAGETQEKIKAMDAEIKNLLTKSHVTENEKFVDVEPVQSGE